MENEFRLLRVSMGLRQEDAAELLGVTQATVSRWETGKAKVAKRNLVALQAMGQAA